MQPQSQGGGAGVDQLVAFGEVEGGGRYVAGGAPEGGHVLVEPVGDGGEVVGHAGDLERQEAAVGEAGDLPCGVGQALYEAAAVAGEQPPACGVEGREVPVGVGGFGESGLVPSPSAVFAGQPGELVDEGVAVDDGAAVEDGDDAVVALQLGVLALGVGAAEETAGAHEFGEPVDGVLGEGGHGGLGDGGDDAHLRGEGVRAAGGDEGGGLGEEDRRGDLAQDAADARQVGEPPPVEVAALGEVGGQAQRVVGRAEGEPDGHGPGELERLEHRLDAAADVADEGVLGDGGVVEGDAADVGAADAVGGDLRPVAVAAVGERPLVDEEEAEAAGAAGRVGAGEYGDQVAAGGVVDQPFLAVEHPAGAGAGRGEFAGEQVAAVVAFGEAPGGDGAALDLRAQGGGLCGVAGDPGAGAAEEGLGVGDGDGEVAAGYGAQEAQQFAVVVEEAAVAGGHVVAGQPEVVERPDRGGGERLPLVEFGEAAGPEGAVVLVGVAHRFFESRNG